MRVLRIAAFAAIAVTLQGCAFTNATFDAKPNADVLVAGPLGEVQPIAFTAPQLDDARSDRARIGFKRNGFGKLTADIMTLRPVDEIVEAAAAKALSDARHTAGADGIIRVLGTVDRFWFDYDMNFWSVVFIADVRCTLDFVDARTRQSIYRSTYSGSYIERKAGSSKAGALAINKALDRLIEDIVLDEELAAALRARVTPPAAM